MEHRPHGLGGFSLICGWSGNNPRKPLWPGQSAFFHAIFVRFPFLCLVSKKRILVAPLDWGLGHATRCVPIVSALLAEGAEVVIAADGGPLRLLKGEFPELEFLELAGYDIQYPKSGNMAFRMLLEAPRIVGKIKWEHRELQRIVDEHCIDAVISDNRFGLHTYKAPCVFITHQIHIQAPVMKGALYKMNTSYIRHYDECWIPDFEGEVNLSAALSHDEKMPDNTFYVGPLSRLVQKSRGSSPSRTTRKIVALISGPEPQRSLFEEMVIDALSKQENPALILRGKPGNDPLPHVPNHLEIHNHLATEELSEAISSASWVLCRPGYSTLMDLACIGTKAVFVPTPGQTEQEYLAKVHMEQGHYYSQPQNRFDFDKAKVEVENYSGLHVGFDDSQLRSRIVALLDRIS